ncbi:MAG TPA: hypothetical protein VJS89_01320 [Gammaproteobacteria bacterium]|nr:hypothetical protein [Gammaproteobacteria bacterium]
MSSAVINPLPQTRGPRRQPRGRVRALESGDLTRIAQLYARVYPARPDAALPELRERLERVLLHHPWPDPRLPSLVYEDTEGELVGFLGVLPRPMMHRDGRKLTAAISHSFLVAPGSRSTLAALQLAKRFLQGPQDLSLAEGNDSSRCLWERFGGSVLPLYSLGWVRPLRPARYALGFLQRRGLRPWLGTLLQPLCGLLDEYVRLVLPKWFRVTGISGAEPLRASVAAAEFARLARLCSLRPVYDADSFGWLLETLRANRTHGELQHHAVVDAHGGLHGWYVYYLRPDSVAEVVQLVADPSRAATVFDHLLHSARCTRAIAVAGALDPAWLGTLAERGCLFHHDGHSWMLMHSRQSPVQSAFHEGRAFVSRLDGEWWISSLLGYH